MSALACKGKVVSASLLLCHRQLSSQFRKCPTFSTCRIAAHQRARTQARPSHFNIPIRAVATTDRSTPSSSMAPPEIPPATLPGTTKHFPISAEKLIELAKRVYESNSGVDDPSLLADDFRFEFPVVSLAKEDYIKAVSSFKLKDAFPNMDSHPYDWRVDHYEPQRVWFTVRSTATHTGPLNFAGTTYKATGKEVSGAPECMSFVFNQDGKVSSFTGGYIMDRRVGNTGKLGALFGILYAIGAPVPKPGSISFIVRLLFARVKNLISGLFGGGKQD